MNKILASVMALAFTTLSATAMAACPTGTTLEKGKCVAITKIQTNKTEQKVKASTTAAKTTVKKDSQKASSTTKAEVKKLDSKATTSKNAVKTETKATATKASTDVKQKVDQKVKS